ncbi:MAG: hypothetical protein RL338_969, partial [Chloroflexota bacterium]
MRGVLGRRGSAAFGRRERSLSIALSVLVAASALVVGLRAAPPIARAEPIGAPTVTVLEQVPASGIGTLIGTTFKVIFRASDTDGIKSMFFTLNGGTDAARGATDGTTDETTEDFDTDPLSLQFAGANYVCGYASDVNDNTSGGTCVEFTVLDNAGPLVTFVSATPPFATPSTTSQTVSFGTPVNLTFRASDRTRGQTSITSGEYRIGTGAWIPTPALDGAYDEDIEDFSTGSLTLAVGSHRFCARAADASGNTGEGPDAQCRTVVVTDDSQPSVRFVSHTSAAFAYGTPYSILFAASDGTTGGSSISTGEYRIDGGAWQTGSATDGSFDEAEEDFSSGSIIVPVGTHLVCGRAIDASGNTSTTSGDTCRTVTVTDESGPAVTVTSAPSGGSVAFGEPFSVVFSASDGTTGASSITSGDIRIGDGGSYAAAAATDGGYDEVVEDFSTGVITRPVGSHEICAVARDASGNTSAETCTTVVVRDESSPSIRVVSAPATPVAFGTPVSVVFSASDGTTGASSITSGDYGVDGGG